MSQWQGGLPSNVVSPPTLSPGWRNTSIFIQGQKPKQANSHNRDPGSKSWLCLLGTWIKDFTLLELSYCLKRSINNIPSRIVTINSAEDVKWNAYDVEGDCLLIKAKELVGVERSKAAKPEKRFPTHYDLHPTLHTPHLHAKTMQRLQQHQEQQREGGWTWRAFSPAQGLDRSLEAVIGLLAPLKDRDQRKQKARCKVY